MSATIRVEIPQHLRQLAAISGNVITVEVEGAVTLCVLLDALEVAYPALRGTIRDHHTRQRRPFLRFFACEEDISLLAFDASLPAAVCEGREPLLIIAGIAGG